MSAPTKGPWAVGHKETFGTYNANTVFGPEGAVAMVYGLPQNTTVEDVPSRYAEGLANARLISLAPEMADLLRSLEWAGEAEVFWEGEFEPACPSCGALKNPKGHTPDCRLGTILKRLP